MDLNKVQLIGRTTQDIELKTTPSGQSVASFSIATNREWKDSNWEKQSQVEFHNIVFWGKLAEIANQYLWKGKRIYVEWRLQTRNWEAQDGTKRYRTEIVWESMIMLDSWEKKEEEFDDSQFEKPKKEAPKKAAPKKNIEPEISIEDIPFR